MFVHLHVVVPDEARLLRKCPDGADAVDCLEEMAVDGRAVHGLDPLQLARRRDVDTLKITRGGTVKERTVWSGTGVDCGRGLGWSEVGKGVV